MVTTFSEIEKIVLKRGALMKFTFTHPMHSHPYNPELVTGSGIATVAAAAEAAGFDGFGFTDHPAPTQRWLESGGHDAKCAPGLGGARVQPPLVQVFAASSAFVDAGEDAVVRKVEKRLGLLGGQPTRVQNAHGITLGNGYDSTPLLRGRVALPHRVLCFGEQPSATSC